MPQQRLHDLGRQLAPAVRLPIDAPRGEEVPEGVQGILRCAGLVHSSRRDEDRLQAAEHVFVMLDLAGAGGEYKTGLALWTRELPFLQGGEHVRGKWDRANTRLRLRMAYRVETIRPLTHMQLACLQVNVSPAHAPQFARAQAGERRDQQQGIAFAALGGLSHALNFVRSRNVAPYLKNALVARAAL